MYGEKETSFGTRITIISAYCLIIVFIVWLNFFGGLEQLAEIFGLQLKIGDFMRRLLLLIFNLIYLARIVLTLFSFLRRKIGWGEAFAIIVALGFYNVSFSVLGGIQPIPVDFIDFFAIGLFLFGSYLNTYSEYQRKQFKKKTENRDKLFTEGLFKYSRHINYFGDVVWLYGFALMTRNPWSLLVPLVGITSFVFFNIPALEHYLKEKYGQEYDTWTEKTKKFVPFVY
jgi:protein-S-isoprenylcysteine O-methyltransferase Ste14